MTTGQLENAERLSRHCDDQDWRILDCRFDLADAGAGRRQYLAGHIPGAFYADLNEDLAAPPSPGLGRHPLPDLGTIASTFSRLGIDNSTRVVVYDGANGAMAARAWWLLRWLGHDDVALLDGGFANWRSLGLPLETGDRRLVPRRFDAQPRAEWVMTTEELVARLPEIGDLNLFDARDRARFRGEVEPIDAVAGHVPGAKNLPFPESLHADGTWKSTAELTALWNERFGTARNVDWAVMCGSGVTACHLAISGLQAGLPEPRLYVGSWSEWITDPARPIGLGDA